MKKLLLILGGAVAVLAVVVAIAYSMHVAKMDALGQESSEYVDRIAPAILADVSEETVFRFASEDMKITYSPDEIKRSAYQLSELGQYIEFMGSEGWVEAIYTPEGEFFVGNYEAKAEFEFGEAIINVNVIKKDVYWELLGLSIKSMKVHGNKAPRKRTLNISEYLPTGCPVPKEFPVKAVRSEVDIDLILNLRSMLENKQFDELNAKLEEFQVAYEVDPKKERKIDEVYKSFKVIDAAYEGHFNVWIAASPDQYQPYLARAYYYIQMAWASRGYASAKNTSDEQTRLKNEYLAKALGDLEKVLSMRDNVLVAQVSLIRIKMLSNSRKGEEELLNKSIKMYPSSALVIANAMGIKRPKWGGSFPEMFAIACNAQEYAADNPGLPLLLSNPLLEMASALVRNKEYEEAKQLLIGVLDYFEHSAMLFELANAQFLSYQEKKALESINKAIAINSTEPSYYALRAKIRADLWDYEGFKEDFYVMETLRPGHSHNAKVRTYTTVSFRNKGHDAFHRGSLEDSIKYYSIAAELNPEDYKTFYWRAVVYGMSDQREESINDLKVAVKLNPENFDTYLMLDRMYSMRDSDIKHVVAAWSNFISLMSGNPIAHYRRALAYQKLGDNENARVDFKEACELGNRESCDLLDEL